MKLLQSEVNVEPGRAPDRGDRPEGWVGRGSAIFEIHNTGQRINGYNVKVECSNPYWNPNWVQLESIGAEGDNAEMAEYPDRFDAGYRTMTVHLNKGARRRFFIKFNVPKRSECRSGVYTFRIVIERLIDEVDANQPEKFVRLPGKLIVRPFLSYEVEYRPSDRRVGWIKRKGRYDLTIKNTGNDWLYVDISKGKPRDVSVRTNTSRISIAPPEPNAPSERTVPVVAGTRLKTFRGTAVGQALPLGLSVVAAPTVPELPEDADQGGGAKVDAAVVARENQGSLEIAEPATLTYYPPLPATLAGCAGQIVRNFKGLVVGAFLLLMMATMTMLVVNMVAGKFEPRLEVIGDKVFLRGVGLGYSKLTFDSGDSVDLRAVSTPMTPRSRNKVQSPADLRPTKTQFWDFADKQWPLDPNQFGLKGNVLVKKITIARDWLIFDRWLNPPKTLTLPEPGLRVGSGPFERSGPLVDGSNAPGEVLISAKTMRELGDVTQFRESGSGRPVPMSKTATGDCIVNLAGFDGAVTLQAKGKNSDFVTVGTILVDKSKSPKPQIGGTIPRAPLTPGDSITITGIHFGNEQGSVEINGENSPGVESWKAGQIRVSLPSDVSKFTFKVVTSAGVSSDPVTVPARSNVDPSSNDGEDPEQPPIVNVDFPGGTVPSVNNENDWSYTYLLQLVSYKKDSVEYTDAWKRLQDYKKSRNTLDRIIYTTAAYFVGDKMNGYSPNLRTTVEYQVAMGQACVGVKLFRDEEAGKEATMDDLSWKEWFGDSGYALERMEQALAEKPRRRYLCGAEPWIVLAALCHLNRDDAGARKNLATAKRWATRFNVQQELEAIDRMEQLVSQ